MAYSDAINTLLAEAAKLYAVKEYDQASEKYADACEAFNIEHNSDDPDLLLLYGKALFQSAVLRSEVFGGSEQPSKKEEKEEDDEEDANFQFHEDALAEENDENENNALEEEEEKDENDENDDNDENEGNEDKDENDDENQSDFEVAWEILDLTRSLFEDRLEALSDANKPTVPFLKNDSEDSENEYIVLTKKLAEVYDLLGEVSLEAENFPQSAVDLQKSLELRLVLYNPDNLSLISEAHYKLSLALEFCVEDEKLREKAAEQMKLAIDSVKRRNVAETDPKKKDENDGLIKDLLVRYNELQKDPAEEMKAEQLEIIKGILGEATGTEKAQKPAGPAVNDLTSMVKKRKPAKDAKDAKKRAKLN